MQPQPPRAIGRYAPAPEPAGTVHRARGWPRRYRARHYVLSVALAAVVLTVAALLAALARSVV